MLCLRYDSLVLPLKWSTYSSATGCGVCHRSASCDGGSGRQRGGLETETGPLSFCCCPTTSFTTKRKIDEQCTVLLTHR